MPKNKTSQSPINTTTLNEQTQALRSLLDAVQRLRDEMSELVQAATSEESRFIAASCSKQFNRMADVIERVALVLWNREVEIKGTQQQRHGVAISGRTEDREINSLRRYFLLVIVVLL